MMLRMISSLGYGETPFLMKIRPKQGGKGIALPQAVGQLGQLGQLGQIGWRAK